MRHTIEEKLAYWRYFWIDEQGKPIIEFRDISNDEFDVMANTFPGASIRLNIICKQLKTEVLKAAGVNERDYMSRFADGLTRILAKSRADQ